MQFPKYLPLEKQIYWELQKSGWGRELRDTIVPIVWRKKKRSHAEKLKGSIFDLCTQPGKMALLCVFVCKSKVCPYKIQRDSERQRNWTCNVSRVCSTLKSPLEPQESTFVVYFFPIHFSQSCSVFTSPSSSRYSQNCKVL